MLVGRTDVIAARIAASSACGSSSASDCDGVNILDDPRYRDYWQRVLPARAAQGRHARAGAWRRCAARPTLSRAMLVRRGDADAMLCGTRGNYADHLRYVRNVIGLRDGVQTLAAMQMLILPGRQLFICDTHVNRDPSAAADRRDDAARRRGGAALRR